MKQENTFYLLPCLCGVHFACHYPALLCIGSHYNREWADNHTLKLYLCYEVICSNGVAVRPTTTTLNIEVYVFLKCREFTYLCVYLVCTCIAWIPMVYNRCRERRTTALAVPAAQPREEHLLPHLLNIDGTWAQGLYPSCLQKFALCGFRPRKEQESIDHFIRSSFGCMSLRKWVIGWQPIWMQTLAVAIESVHRGLGNYSTTSTLNTLPLSASKEGALPSRHNDPR